MPDACRDEMGMAYALRKPIVIFCEEGVEINGFAKHYGTSQVFSRIDLASSEHIGKAIRAIRDLYLKALRDFTLDTDMAREDVHSERTKLLVDLNKDRRGWFWELVVKKRLVFNKDYEQPITDGAWASSAVHVPSNAAKIDFGVTLLGSSRGIKLTPHLRSHTALLVDCVTSVFPKPVKGDWIEYEVRSRSKYLNPVTMNDLRSADAPYVINDTRYHCLEGLVPVQQTEELEVELRFEQGYPLDCRCPSLVAGPHSNSLDRVDKEETARMICKERETINGETRIKAYIAAPKQNFVYGILWNPLDASALARRSRVKQKV